MLWKTNIKKWLKFIGASVTIAFLTIVILLPDSAISDTAQNMPSVQEDSRLPFRLTIPAISVDATIEYVGVAPDGAMDVPKGPNNVAWFELGPQPGDIGSAVIAGHYGWKNGIPAVFDGLSKLQKGDQMFIEDKKGTVTTFIVRELRLLSEHENASDVFDSSDDKSHLNLITCEGTWSVANKSYSKRLVVFTDKE